MTAGAAGTLAVEVTAAGMAEVEAGTVAVTAAAGIAAVAIVGAGKEGVLFG